MLLLVKKMAQGFVQFNKAGDPRAKSYKLLDSTWPIVTILTLYTLFVFKIGPILMRNRKPFNLKRILVVYNFIQICVNFYGILYFSKIYHLFNIYCTPINWSESSEAYDIIYAHHYFLGLKIFDLLDTIFFVLKKNDRQVTFLHVYHHIGMTIGTWLTVKFIPGGQMGTLGVVNAFVHVIMYFYYLLSAWNPKWKENITLKKTITQLQLVQHFYGLLLCILPFFQRNCEYPKLLLALYIPQAFMMIFMFSEFYYKTYIKRKSQ